MTEVEIDQRLYELYQVWCSNHGVKADIKGYLVWLEERE